MNEDENCVEKVLSHLYKLDRIENPVQRTDEERLLARYGIKYICDNGEGKRFCEFMDKVAQKEKELGRKLTGSEYLQIDINLGKE